MQLSLGQILGLMLEGLVLMTEHMTLTNDPPTPSFFEREAIQKILTKRSEVKNDH